MQKTELKDGVPILSWADYVEPSAMAQAINLAKLPFIVGHVALMPDCLPAHSEVLTKDGFVRIDDYIKSGAQTEVAVFDETSKLVSYEIPKGSVSRPPRDGEKKVTLTLQNGKTLEFSEGHRMSYLPSMGVKAMDLPKVMEMSDLVWNGSGLVSPEGVALSDNMIRLIVWVVGDGNLHKNYKGKPDTVRFGFRRDRKVSRLKFLLESLGLKFSYSETEHKTMTGGRIAIDKNFYLDTVISRMIIDIVGEKKEFPVSWAYTMNKDQARIVLEEAVQVDGDYRAFLNNGVVRLNSMRQSDIDFFASLAVINGAFVTIFNRPNKLMYASIVDCGGLIESPSGLNRWMVTSSVSELKEEVHCLTVSTGFFVCRQNGICFITGNCHTGFGMPVGGVIATDNVVIPYAVGSDISCGMNAVRLQARVEDLTEEKVKAFMSGVRKRIPLGFNHHQSMQGIDLMPAQHPGTVTQKLFDDARTQVGTLGGGNHFIELQRDEDGYLWIMIHSGSRNVGNTVMKHYNKVAVELNAKWHSSVPPSAQLAYLPLDTPDGQDYMEDMRWCMEFAACNRKLMMRRAMESFLEAGFNAVTSFERDINHNYAAMEEHFGKKVLVHRKGATSARAGEIGIIPGSMGSSSYIVEGKGSKASLESCSHGAGRKVSRGESRKTLSFEEESAKLSEMGVIHGMRNEQDLDEAPGAYKNIEDVMSQQTDLVSIVHKLTPLAVVKG